MLKTTVTVLLLVLNSLGQSSDSLFTVRYTKKFHFILSAAQIGEAQKLYESASAVVQREFRANKTSRPRLTVVLGAERNELTANELRLKEWNPELFAQAVVVLSFDEMLPVDLKMQLTQRAIHSRTATADVKEPSQDH